MKIRGESYCFGGRYVIRLMESDIVTVGVINHPSWFKMEEVDSWIRERNYQYALLR